MSRKHQQYSGGSQLLGMIVLIFAALLLAKALTSVVHAKDRCLSPDCSWLNTKNGDLTASMLPGRYDVPHYWRGWLDYERKVRDICNRPGNACMQETRVWLQQN